MCATHATRYTHDIWWHRATRIHRFFFLFSLATPVATTDDNEKNDSFAFSVCHNIKSSRNFYFFVNKYLFEFFGFDFGLTQTANRSIYGGNLVNMQQCKNMKWNKFQFKCVQLKVFPFIQTKYENVLFVISYTEDINRELSERMRFIKSKKCCL